ncbi:Endo-beta-1,4-glucanase celB [Aspergillus mulundensis]|uniref:Glucanase n=1 Tax=Aspergillus mulundensis TaxID=1810919 RepID=A0A3D8SLD7_9EURO|nr:Endo-beta-1,4-glucanase celB [Aspergillus mulundensis]RDW87149.1 Endo-beta-1,4-glucanase celB [Aspergillus mulundensis]
MAAAILSLALLLATGTTISAQQIGTPENRPRLTTHYCTSAQGCVRKETSVVLDAATHSIHDANNPSISCTTGGGLNPTLCPDKETCAESCVIDGITDYAARGVETDGSKLILTQYRNFNGSLSSVSPRVYLVDESSQENQEYEVLTLLAQEFTFTVNVSALPCGMNGALYLSEMSPSGGRSELNPAGASYGTGYCDAQCYVNPWVNGEANVDGHGACCNEMDIWEGNSRATGFTPHACLYDPEDASSGDGGVYECATEDECDSASENDGICDKWGCGFNPYALGDQEYYGRGRGFEVNSKEPFTVVTQFLTDDGTTTGALTEIRRLYIQKGQIIQNAVVASGADSLTDSLCGSTTSWFDFFGGMEGMGRALGRGMVLAMSIWNDAGGYMQWLDGGDSGPCNATEGAPSFIEANTPWTNVVFEDLRWGDIGSTFNSKGL